jgi:hypothetical protein
MFRYRFARLTGLGPKVRSLGIKIDPENDFP